MIGSTFRLAALYSLPATSPTFTVVPSNTSQILKVNFSKQQRENGQFQPRIQADNMKIARERLDEDTLIFWHEIFTEEHADALGSDIQ